MAYVPPILRIFVKSPFKPLDMHIGKVRETVDLLNPAMQAYCKEDFKEVQRLADEISTLEHECDIIKRDIRKSLPKSILMPVDRGDVLGFLKEQDAIADTAEDVAILLTMREIRNLPKDIKDKLIDLTAKVVESVDALEIASKEIDELIESSFSKIETEKIVKIIHKVDQKEWEADKIGVELVKSIYKHENRLKLKSIHLKELSTRLGEIADHAENAGDRIRIMMARG